MTRWLIMFLLLPVAAWGSHRTITSDSLPYTCNLAGTNYSETLLVSGTISSATSGISFSNSSHYVVLRGVNGDKSDSLIFGTGNGNSNYGIRFVGSMGDYLPDSGGACRIIVEDLVIRHGATTDAVTGNIGMNFGTGSNVKIDNCNIRVRGNACRCVYRGSGQPFWGVYFKDCKFENYGISYTDRSQYECGAVTIDWPHVMEMLDGSDTVRVSKALTDYDSVYTIRLEHCIVSPPCPHVAFAVCGVVQIEACTAWVDARSDSVTAENHANYRSTANASGIDSKLMFSGTVIKKNAFYADSNYAGMNEGMLLQATQAHNQAALVCSNYVSVHRGYDHEWGYMVANGIRTRWGNDNLKIFDNEIYAYAGDTSLSYMGNTCVGIDFYSETEGEGAWVNSNQCDSNVDYYNNHIEAILVDNNFTNGVSVGAFAVRCATTNQSSYNWTNAGCSWYGNYLTSSKALYYPGSWYSADHLFNSTVFEGDSIELGEPLSGISQYVWYFPYYNSSQDTGHAGKDIINFNEETLTSAYFNTGAGETEIRIGFTCTTWVMGNNSLLCSDAEVIFENNYNDTIVTDTTDDNGYVIQYLEVYGVYETAADSTFKPWTAYAIKSGVDSSVAFNPDWDDHGDTIYLDLAGDISDTTIYQLLTCTDTSTTSLILSDNFTLENTVIDSMILEVSANNWSSQVWAETTGSPSDPYVDTADGLSAETGYKCRARAWDSSVGITDTSNILTITTEAVPETTLDQSIACTDTFYYKLIVWNAYTTENVTIDTCIIYLTDGSYTVIDSSIDISVGESTGVEFICLDGNTGYKIFAVAWDSSISLVDYSETLSVTTSEAPSGIDSTGWDLLYSYVPDSTRDLSDGDTVGTDGWLTIQLVNNGAINETGCYSALVTDDYTDVALIHSTDTLPDEYLIRMKWGYFNYDTTNYEIPADNGRYSYGWSENGIYLLVIGDSVCSDCSEDWWHHRRKYNIDIDNSPEGNHPIYFVYFDTIQIYGNDKIYSWDGSEWDTSYGNWNVGYTYSESTYYWVELRKQNSYIDMKLYDENESLLVETDSFSMELATNYDEPDIFYCGEPHDDDYEGAARLEAVYLFVPEEETPVVTKRMRVFK